MTESATAVALVFDDAELGGHLRDALRERGARIVFEGTLPSLSRAALEEAGTEVVVVNLDDDALDALDRLDEAVDTERMRVVFNDAQASRGLDGWDRARWARHLAAKVLAQDDLDPPRPADAPAFVPPQAAIEEEPLPAAVGDVVSYDEIEPVAAAVIEEAPVAEETPSVLAAEEPVSQASVETSETLAAELEALLAADEPAAAEDDFGSGLNYAAGQNVELHDGDFGAAEWHDAPDVEMHDIEVQDEPFAEPEPAPAAARPAFQLDHLALAPLDDSFAPATASKATGGASDFAQASSWSLVDDDALSASIEQSRQERTAPTDFGIEKLSAADYLAPEGGEAHELEPGLSLELVSIEEAIAPQRREDHEVILDDLDSAVGRVLLLGAAADSTDSVCQFLSALPSNLRMTVLHTQHHAFEDTDTLTERLKAHASLPVKVAGRDSRARQGEILFVPAGQQVRLLRDGRIESQVVDANAPQQPSIDASFTMAASVFGRDAIAIVFAGNATDAVAGAQAIHDRGGQVWVETTIDDHYTDMVHGVAAERLVSFTGTPHELAARLIEHLS